MDKIVCIGITAMALACIGIAAYLIGIYVSGA
jgi:hypothetical protein